MVRALLAKQEEYDVSTLDQYDFSKAADNLKDEEVVFVCYKCRMRAALLSRIFGAACSYFATVFTATFWIASEDSIVKKS